MGKYMWGCRNEKVEESAPWFEMKEVEEKAAAEKKEKQGYNTGITYK